MTPTELGEIIKVTRCYTGLNQKTLALKANISEVTIRSIETGRRAPSLEVLNRIGLALGCSVTIHLVPKLIKLKDLKEILE